MESNQASNSPSSGSSSPSITVTDNCLEKTILRNDSNGVESSDISSINTSSSAFDDDDDDEGFVSGGEEFETALDRPVETLIGEEEGGDGEALASPVFVKMPVAMVTLDDDVDEEGDDDAENVRVLSGEVEGLGSTEAVVVKPEPVIVESNSNLNVVTDDKVEVFTDCNGDTEDEVPKLDLESGTKSEVEDNSETLKAEKLETVVEVEKGNEVVENINEDSKPVEVNDVDNTGEGNSIVQSIHGNMPEPGVAVVEVEDVNSEIPKSDSEAKKSDDGVLETINPELVEEDGEGIISEKGNNVSESKLVDVSEPEVTVVNEIIYEEGEDSVVEPTHVGVSEPEEVVNSEILETEPEPRKTDNEVPETVLPLVEGYGEEIAREDSVLENKLVNVSKPEVVVVDEVKVNEGPEVVELTNALKETEVVNGSNQTSSVSNPDILENSETSTIHNVEVSESEPLETKKEVEIEADFDAKPLEKTEEVSEREAEIPVVDERDMGDSLSDEETDGMIFGSSEAAKQFIEELERESGSGSHFNVDSSREIDGQIVTDSEEEVDYDEEEEDGEGEGKEILDAAAFAALFKAATGGDGSDGGGNITITSQDGSRLFSIERPAGLGSSIRSSQPIGRQNRSSLFSPSGITNSGESDKSLLSEEEIKKLESLQQLRVKFLRLVRRLGASPEDSVAAQVLYRLALVAGRPNYQTFSLDAAKQSAFQLEEEENGDLEFSINILVLGKCGVGKSSTINSIFGEEKAKVGSFEPGTSTVREITGIVDGVKIKVIDTPGLKSSVMEQSFNRKVLAFVKKFTKKSPPDIVLYVDRLDTQTRDLNDLPLLKTITGSLGPSIWRSAIVTLTHGASAPPDGQSGTPLNYEVSVTQRSHVVQQSIGHSVGDLRMMSPSLMNPVSLVENHPLCRKNRDGQKVLPNGQTWKPQLLLLCYSMKILSEANSISKPQDPFDHRKLFGFRARTPPLPYLLSSMLQTRAHPKLPSNQGIDNGDSDVDLADFSDSDQEDEEDEYDQLPPFKPLRKAQIARLSKEQRKAYFEEYDYRVKLLQKKQWKDELRRMKEMKKRGNNPTDDYGYIGDEADQENEGAAPVATPLPDMVLPLSFDSDNPAYRYRFLEPTSQFLARPVLDTHGWDHDCGYDGVVLEQSLAIANQFPAAVSVQITKDKKDFSINLDSAIAAKHGENGSTMAGFDIQNVGKQLAYVVRGETKFKNLKKNKTAAGISVTFLGENVATGLKVEDQIALGKQWAMVGSAGTVRCQGEAAYGANFELQRRELDYPIGQVQSTYGLSLIKWRGDWALGLNTVAQFAVGRNSKVALRAGINNKLSGQITLRTSSSDHLSLMLVGIIPIASSIYKKLRPAAGDNYAIY